MKNILYMVSDKLVPWYNRDKPFGGGGIPEICWQLSIYEKKYCSRTEKSNSFVPYFHEG
jgi:hypothetical protein